MVDNTVRMSQVIYLTYPSEPDCMMADSRGTEELVLEYLSIFSQK